MCASCGPGQTHIDEAPTASPKMSSPARFAALRDRNCRKYLGGSLLSMCADNVEHVISEYRTVALLTSRAAWGHRRWSVGRVVFLTSDCGALSSVGQMQSDIAPGGAAPVLGTEPLSGWQRSRSG